MYICIYICICIYIHIYVYFFGMIYFLRKIKQIMKEISEGHGIVEEQKEAMKKEAMG